MEIKEKTISSKIDKVLFETGMIRNGDKVLLAVSGGKDSLALAYFLSKKQGRFAIDFTVEAVHIDTEFNQGEFKQKIFDFFDEWGLAYHRLSMDVQARLKPGRTMNCYWCSTLRRTELLRFADEKGFSKIALGHHMDDILETFFMNMIYKSELSTMLPLMQYDRYPQAVIRPLARVHEREIIAFGETMGFTGLVCDCGFDKTSKRLKVRKLINNMAEQEGHFIRDNIYASMGNVNSRYLPGTGAEKSE